VLLLCSFRDDPFGAECGVFPARGAGFIWEVVGVVVGVSLDEEGVPSPDEEALFFFGIGPKRRFNEMSVWLSDFLCSAGEVPFCEILELPGEGVEDRSGS